MRLLTALALAGLISHTTALTVAATLNVVEYTPILLARDSFYNATNITITNGGVPSLFAASHPDLAGNAETQALRNFATHKNLRIIYTIAEVAYRLVASKKAGVTTLADLKGKKIGSSPSTSAAYFVEKLLRTAALEPGDYTIVSGGICNTPPCAASSLPGLLASGAVDAVGLWEPTLQHAIEAIGADAVTFQNRTVYREIYNLHSTAEKLADPATRKNIVEFLRGLNKAEKVFQDTPDSVYARVSAAVNVSAPTLKAVWADHDWSGPRGLPKDLLDVLVEEDKWIGRVEKREPMSREVLSGLIDESVFKEAFPNGA